MSDVGFYRLTELDGTSLEESVTGNCLKKFFSREDFEGDVDEGLEISGADTDPIDDPASFWSIQSEKAGEDAGRRAGGDDGGLFDG